MDPFYIIDACETWADEYILVDKLAMERAGR